MNILFLTPSRKLPSGRFRVNQFVQPLRGRGHSVELRCITPDRFWLPPFPEKSILRLILSRIATLRRLVSAFWILRDAEKFDVIFMNRDLLPEQKICFVEEWLAKRNPRLVFDFDDAIHLGGRAEKLKRILPHFALVVAGNEYLADYARQFNKHVEVWPTVIDMKLYRANTGRRGVVRLGWIGSRWTLKDYLPLLRDVLIRLAETEIFEFIIIADTKPALDWKGVNVKYIPWSEEREGDSLAELDIGLMPLKDAPFEKGKCGCKAIQYMGAGIPAVVSPVGVNKEIVVHGETGFHCKNDEEWLRCLRLLIHDEELRLAMGKKGRQRASMFYSQDPILLRMEQSFKYIAEMFGTKGASGQAPSVKPV